MGINLSIRQRLFVMILVSLALMAAIALMGLTGMTQVERQLQTVYDDRLVPMGQLGTISELLMSSRMNLRMALSDPSQQVIDSSLERVRENQRRMDLIWAEYVQTFLTPREARLASNFDAQRGELQRLGIDPLVSALESWNWQEGERILQGDLARTYQQAADTLREMMDLQLEVGRQVYEESLVFHSRIRNGMVLIFLLGLAITATVGGLLMRRITSALDQLVTATGRMAQGDLQARVPADGNDELTRCGRAFNDMSDSFRTILGQDPGAGEWCHFSARGGIGTALHGDRPDLAAGGGTAVPDGVGGHRHE
ncbi:hypothetical protein CKO35_07005 [Ectothiorhodospira shaposhnikovii]|uniref:MCP four helix bundle domain-containing protein n=1 Tax=Ectothiorhodospira shaposhnikovii TaxID=1054 RepID=UPI00190468CB|nr:MCP four helix bundle domain-containing protein [Ectothiorhodospira shaposhnikovii]MBK1673058.1 hypothetical protein [Ectothiorhodospira shaposhnikovii]